MSETLSEAEARWGSDEDWALEPDMDPRNVLAQNAVRDERSFDAYTRREAWTMQPGVEVTPTETAQ